MERSPTIVDLNGRTYIIGDWDVDKSLETMVYLAKTFGEGFLSLFVSKDGLDNTGVLTGNVKDEQEEEALRDFVLNILNNLEPKEYVKYAKIIVQGVKCDGEPIDFKYHFVGRMFELHRLLFEILKHQYSDFLGGGVDAE